MTDMGGGKRTDSASRIVRASPAAIYQAFLNPAALVVWLPPTGMTCTIDRYEARAGGRYRMTLTYEEPDHSVAGKTSENEDVVEGEFLELVPNGRIVQLVEFQSEDTAFSGAMKMTWALTPVPEGTVVSILCENVPAGIRKEDHDAGLKSTLDNLAVFTENQSTAGR